MTTEEFQDRVVLVAGGSSGIGLAAARAFARRNAKVVVAARGVERGEQAAHELTSEGGRAIFVCADMEESEDIRRMVRTTVSVYGRLDCAFNNAAAEGALALTADFTEEQFDHMIRVNLKGIWLCMKHEIQQMLGQNPSGGVIVNTSSVNGLGGAPRGAPYSASKAGVIALTKSASQEYAKLAVRVSVLAAGAFGPQGWDRCSTEPLEIVRKPGRPCRRSTRSASRWGGSGAPKRPRRPSCGWLRAAHRT